MRFEHIIYIDKGKVTVYRFLKNKSKFEYLKRDGDESYLITDDFWNWWKKASDYIEDEDEADICFIYDDVNNTIVTDSFVKGLEQVSNSRWTAEVIKVFCEEMLDYSQIEFKMSDTESVLFDNAYGSIIPKKVFFTNKNVTGLSKEKEEVEEEQEVEEADAIATEVEEEIYRKSIKRPSETSTFAMYFKDLRRREKES